MREIPFRDGIVHKIQMGFVLGDAKERLFRYSRSMTFVRARYRITLQSLADEDHTPYVFDVVRPAPKAVLDIRPEGEPTQNAWKIKSPLKENLERALHTIYELDIECA